MTMLLAVSRLDVAGFGGVPPAAAVLTQAHRADPAGWLLGGVAAIHDDTMAMQHYVDVVTISQRLGRVDLVHNGEDLVGVACWIEHRARPGLRHLPPVPPPNGGAGDAPDRRSRGRARIALFDLPFRVFDLAFDVPGDAHLHLACLGTSARYDSRMVADLLLCEQHKRADHDGHSLHVEAHCATDRRWLRSLGYHLVGAIQGMPGETSYAMSRPVPQVPQAGGE